MHLAARVRAVVDVAARQYRYVVLDVARADTTALDALDSAKAIIVVANQELATVRGATRIAATLRQRYGKDRIRVVISRYDAQSEIGQDDVERTIGVPVKHTFPSDYRLALKALNQGRPVALENHNALSGSVQKFARELASIAEAPPESSTSNQPSPVRLASSSACWLAATLSSLGTGWPAAKMDHPCGNGALVVAGPATTVRRTRSPSNSAIARAIAPAAFPAATT